jgi:phosphoribosylformylglycinamidine synthase
MTRAEVAIIQFPGVNCEWETARALESVGLRACVRRWNLPSSDWLAYSAFVLPGGFSYQDRVRAGAIAAREPVLERVADAAAKGVPILGICNGAQVLVEAGLVPGLPPGRVDLSLAPNRMPGRSGYYTRWVNVEVTSSPCVFTTGVAAGTRLPVPIAHAEGRFTTADDETKARLLEGRGVAFRYVTGEGTPALDFPDNPNGAIGAAAGITNESGNVLALMPHPERASWLWQLPPALPGPWGEAKRAWQRDRAAYDPMSAPGPGRELFRALARYLETS